MFSLCKLSNVSLLKKPVLLVDACLENAGLSALFQRA